MRSTIPCSPARSAALSAAVAAPVPPRDFTMLSSMGLMNWSGATRSTPCTITV